MAANKGSICVALRMLEPLLQIEWVLKATPQLLYAPVKAPGLVVGEVMWASQQPQRCMEKRKLHPPGFEPRIVQPVASP